MTKKMRDSNIELLRILAVLGVIILHFNGSYAHAFDFVNQGTIQYYVLHYLESLFIPAVNLFILISGYYMCGTYKRPIIKPMLLIAQVILMNEAIYLATVVLGAGKLSLRQLIGNALPCNYYVILYVALYFLSPYINLIMDKLQEKTLHRFLIIMVLLFSIWPVVVDLMQEVLGQELMGLNTVGMHGDQNGYTIVNFVLMYIIGAYLKKKGVSWSKRKAFLIALVCSIVLTIWSLVLPNTAWIYCNPIVILQAVAVFVGFKQLNFSNGMINTLSKGVFTCFLFHGPFVQRLPVAEWVNANVIIMFLLIVASMIGIYLICWCVWGIYNMFEKLVLKKMLKVFDKMVLEIEPQEKGELCK